MQEVRVLGIAGSPRANGNTAQLVKKALEGARSISGVSTELYEMAGKKMHHCIGCFKCLDVGACVFKDDFQDFARRYVEADGVIIGSPVYHMSVPGSMKAALDRLGNSIMCSSRVQGKMMPMFSKVCGVLTVGAHRNGGQDLVLSFLLNSSLLMNGIVVAGNTMQGDYIGTAGFLAASVPKEMSRKEMLAEKDMVLNDEVAVTSAMNLGKRVAEVARIVKAGISILGKELPGEYFYKSDELFCKQG
jgi:multimeric flavodoxin WrbA